MVIVVAVVRHLFNAVNIGNKNILFNNGKKRELDGYIYKFKVELKKSS